MHHYKQAVLKVLKSQDEKDPISSMLVSFYWPLVKDLIIWKYHNQAIHARTAGLLVGLLVEESPSLYSGNKPFCFKD